MTKKRSPHVINSDILFHQETKRTIPVKLDYGEEEMLPAGTLINHEGKAVNDATAMGVLMADTWKDYYSGQGVLLIGGHVDLAKAEESCGYTYSSEAKAMLKNICFVGDTEVPSGGGGDCDWNLMKNKPFEETVSYADKLTWDGNTDGLDCFDGYLYRISDSTPTLEDIQGGVKISVSTGESLEIELRVTENGIMWNEPLFIVPNDNLEFQGMTFEKKGIYVLSEEGAYVSAVEIDGYTFEEIKIKPIESKYLPITVLYGEGRYLYKDEALTEKVSKSELLEMMGGPIYYFGYGVYYTITVFEVFDFNNYIRVRVPVDDGAILEFHTSEFIGGGLE